MSSVTEVRRWIQTVDAPVDLALYRTRSGLEVDLLLTTPHGIWGLEAKSAARLAPADWRSLRAVGEALGGSWRGGIVVHPGVGLRRLGENLRAVPPSACWSEMG